MAFELLTQRASVGSCVCFAAVLVMGYGSSEDVQMREVDQRHVRPSPVAWRVLNARGKTVVLGKEVGYCHRAPKPRVARVKGDEGPKEVVLTMVLENPPRKQTTCMGLELSFSEIVRLEANIDGRPIYDGSTSPPSRRWPRPG